MVAAGGLAGRALARDTAPVASSTGTAKPAPTFTEATPPHVDCDALLTPADVKKACGVRVSRAAPPPAADVLSIGICMRRFADRHGTDVRLTLERSSSAEENHADGEEVLRSHGGDHDYAVLGLTPAFGAVWRERATAHAAMFESAWHLELVSAPTKKYGRLCSAKQLGTLIETATRRLPE